jgi:hypothetical protein
MIADAFAVAIFCWLLLMTFGVDSRVASRRVALVVWCSRNLSWEVEYVQSTKQVKILEDSMPGANRVRRKPVNASFRLLLEYSPRDFAST